MTSTPSAFATAVAASTTEPQPLQLETVTLGTMPEKVTQPPRELLPSATEEKVTSAITCTAGEGLTSKQRSQEELALAPTSLLLTTATIDSVSAAFLLAAATASTVATPSSIIAIITGHGATDDEWGRNKTTDNDGSSGGEEAEVEGGIMQLKLLMGGGYVLHEVHGGGMKGGHGNSFFHDLIRDMAEGMHGQVHFIHGKLRWEDGNWPTPVTQEGDVKVDDGFFQVPGRNWKFRKRGRHQQTSILFAIVNNFFIDPG
ncbi:unnamed protein product [Linum trigynum]|uniref:Uncharacterized protein n=1 Tax=Linum trigynum TaxID=586398 RepID=A0AAV2D7Z5_9ROSI